MLDVKKVLTKILQNISAHENSNYIAIESYDSWSNAYTCPSDGYVFIFTGSGTGYVSINNVGAIGGATQNREMVFVRKGTKVYRSGTVQVVRFIPLIGGGNT